MQNTIGDIKQALAKVLPTLPHKMGVVAVEFSMEAFKKEAWVGSAWKPRQSDKDNKGRGILVKSGTLKRSIRITSETRDSTTIGTDVIYAKVHNEGSNESVQVPAHLRTINLKAVGKGKQEKPKQVQVKAHSRKMNMPKRQFMGASPELTKRLTNMVQSEIMKNLKV